MTCEIELTSHCDYVLDEYEFPVEITDDMPCLLDVFRKEMKEAIKQKRDNTYGSDKSVLWADFNEFEFSDNKIKCELNAAFQINGDEQEATRFMVKNYHWFNEFTAKNFQPVNPPSDTLYSLVSVQSWIKSVWYTDAVPCLTYAFATLNLATKSVILSYLRNLYDYTFVDTRCTRIGA